MERVGLEDRDPTIPPVDALAEAIVLHGLLTYPERLDAVDVAPLLTFPEHRAILDALYVAHRASAGEPWSQFYLRWINVCEERRRGLSDVLDYDLISASWQRWVRTRIDREDLGVSQAFHTATITDYDWWLERLRRVAEARRLIADAQLMAERAWRGDVAGAQSVAQRMRIQRGVMRIEV